MRQICSINGLEYINDYYYVTTCGKIYSVKNKLRILKYNIHKNGYALVHLMTEEKKKKAFLVHRLVALAFLNNPTNKPQVNHKNEIKICNYINNLEWVSCSENINYGTRNERDSKSKTGISNFKIKKEKNGNSKSFTYYENTPVLRRAFKVTCDRMEWNFDNFDEIFASWYIYTNGKRERKYFYKRKNLTGMGIKANMDK